MLSSSRYRRCRRRTRRRTHATDHTPHAARPTSRTDLTPRDVEGLLDELRAYHAHFSPFFARTEQRHWALQYLHGLLLDLPRKSIEPMALALPEGNVRAMQQFIGEGAWDDAAILAAHQRLVAETLGEPDGVLIVDGSEFPKKGEASVGVARQYCGALGKVANCQAGVFVAYAASRGYTLLDRRLYLPAQWFTPAYRARRRRCGIPPGTQFRTSLALVWEMIEAIHRAGVLPLAWVTFDEAFGQDTGLLARLEETGLKYLAEVPCSTRVWLQRPTVLPPQRFGRGRPRTYARVAPDAPAPQRVDAIARPLPTAAWRTYTIKDGAKGPIRAAFAFLRVFPVRARLPGPESWLVLRRTLGPQPVLKYYLSNAPAHTAPRPWCGSAACAGRSSERSRRAKMTSGWTTTKPAPGAGGTIIRR